MIHIIILIVVILLIMGLMAIKNRFVSLDNFNKEAFSNLKVHMQLRLDLIPNLVNTVKGYTEHEKTTLTKVIEARNKLVSIDLSNIDNIEEISKYENELVSALKHISMLSESYPDLKADSSFISLQEKLSEIEENILQFRKYYNATSRNLNIFTEKLPYSLFYKVFKFRTAKYFDEDVKDKDYNVEVKF